MSILHQVNQATIAVNAAKTKLVTHEVDQAVALLQAALNILEKITTETTSHKTGFARRNEKVKAAVTEAKKDFGHLFKPKDIAKGEYVKATNHESAVKKLCDQAEEFEALDHVF